ncbi:MAG: cytidine deaminase [Bacteroidota bacterium]
MKKIEYKIIITEHDSVKELPEADQELLRLAGEASKVAYAPYSKFHVGAAVRLANSVCVKGSNQENVAYPSGLCAERVAVFAASAQYPGIAIEVIAITAFAEEFEVDFPVTPCGSCRQVLSEYEHLYGKNIKIILSGHKGKLLVIEKVEDLLPLSFKADNLRK